MPLDNWCPVSDDQSTVEQLKGQSQLVSQVNVICLCCVSYLTPMFLICRWRNIIIETNIRGRRLLQTLTVVACAAFDLDGSFQKFASSLLMHTTAVSLSHCLSFHGSDLCTIIVPSTTLYLWTIGIVYAQSSANAPVGSPQLR